MLATLLRPHAGTARVLGHALPREGWAVRGRIGLLGHEPLLYRDLTARENLRFHARLHGVARDAHRASCSTPSGWRARADEPVRTLLARHGRSASPSAAPCCTTPSCCCSTSRAPTSTRGAAELVEPLIGRERRTRVLIQPRRRAALAEADVVLGLRDGRADAARAPASDADDVRGLYR